MVICFLPLSSWIYHSFVVSPLVPKEWLLQCQWGSEWMPRSMCLHIGQYGICPPYGFWLPSGYSLFSLHRDPLHWVYLWARVQSSLCPSIQQSLACLLQQKAMCSSGGKNLMLLKRRKHLHDQCHCHYLLRTSEAENLLRSHLRNMVLWLLPSGRSTISD